MNKLFVALVASLVLLAADVAAEATYSVATASTAYSASGGLVTFNVALSFPAGAVPSIGAKPPTTAWAYVSESGADTPTVKPNPNDTTDPSNPSSVFGFSYVSPPSGSASFSFILRYPAGLTGSQAIAFTAGYRLNGTLTPVTVPAITLPGNPNDIVITTPPANLTINQGQTATFTVVASGNSSLSYQWKKGTESLTDGSNISGATTATLTLSNAQTADAGDYVCVVTNGVGSATSNAAQLTVAARIVRIVSQTAASGTQVVVPIQLLSAGDENSVTFGLQFNPAKLTYVSHAAGADMAGGTVTANVTPKDNGQLGFLIGKAPDTVHAEGTRTLITITFTVAAGVVGDEVLPLTFADQPTSRGIFSVNGAPLPGGFASGQVTETIGLEGDINGDGEVDGGDWVKLGRMVVGLDPPSTGGGAFMWADIAPRTSKGDGTVDGGDWVQLGRYVVGLDVLQPAGGPSSPQL